MALQLKIRPATPAQVAPRRRTRSEAGRVRRRLSEQDVIAARLAELHHIQVVLAEAADVVGTGWVQHGWFASHDEQGHRHVATAYDLHRTLDRPVVGACLVGAVVLAGGGPRAVHTQLVQRTLDLTWHTLAEDAHQPVHWCPSPPDRAAHVRDLTRWNDQPGRVSDDVTTLLHATSGAADAEIARVRRL